MSPALETLDQLLGGDLPLKVIRTLFDEEERFVQALLAMLNAGEVRLLDADGFEFERWQWRGILTDPSSLEATTGQQLTITQVGCSRIS
jgi:hypothetical protein